ncbi:PIN domain-containing protein [Dyella subtropica]|uniref:PIN domain-containing protein n=1 Tax=Dyella subtropica TaxID=2992127 RepID=UPI00224D2E6E|nr:PIN domain-containing protein [Dyella subtropica]
MSLTSGDITDLIGLGAPILCVDTCTILDVIRDITRESVLVHDVKAGLSLLASAETRTDLVVLVADQVMTELAVHLSEVEQEASTKLTKFQAQAQRIHDIAAEFGASGALQTHHLHGHVVRARAVLDRWVAVAKPAPGNDGITARAFARVNAPRTPARKGKDSMKDCVVVETYIEAAQELRTAGLTVPIVFASSNTKEYYVSGGSQLPSDIAADFLAVKMDYAPNFGAAKHNLGL